MIEEFEGNGGARRRLRRVIILAVVMALLAAAALLLVERMRAWPHVPTYGAMLHPYGRQISYQDCGFHTGQDWFAPSGTPIFAIESGQVVYVGPLWLDAPGTGRGPNSIVLLHADRGYYTTYSHNRVALVSQGEWVARGQQIAEIGDLGYSPSPHLHLEKVIAPFTGDWRRPFVGCDGYINPGDRWSPF